MAQPVGCGSHGTVVQARLEGDAAALGGAADLELVSKVQQLQDGDNSTVGQAAFLEAGISIEMHNHDPNFQGYCRAGPA